MKTHSILIDGLRKNQEQGLTTAYRQYNKKLLLFAMRYLKNREIAEEIVSDTFVKMWRNRLSFDTDEKLQAFLYICTKNACLNHLRKPALLDPLEIIENTDFALSKDVDAYTKIIHAELIMMINEEVARLSTRQREVFEMSFFEGLTVEEISKRLAVSVDVVYANRSRALAILRNQLKLKNSLFISTLFCALVAQQ